MKIHINVMRILPLAGAALVTMWLAVGCTSYGGYPPSGYGSVGISTGYYYGGGYYNPWYGRPYPPYGGRPPGGGPPPSSGPPRPMNPIAMPPRPGHMPSIPSSPRPATRR
jgi:hypothetical protein